MITSPTDKPLDPLSIGLVDRQRAVDAAHGALHQLQGEDPEVLVLGVAVLFHAVATHCGLDPHDLTMKAAKVLRDEEFHRRANCSAQSLRDFLSLRVLGRRHTTIS